MNLSQASVPRTGARLVASRADGPRAIEMIDRAWAAGDAVLPLDPAIGHARSVAIATRMRAHRFVDPSGSIELDTGSPVPSGTALVIRTSGTTGRARGVIVSHATLGAAVAASVDRLDAGHARWLAVLPVHHIAGVLVALRARAAGTTPIVHDRFDVSRIDDETDATHVALVPTMLHRLLDHGANVGRFDRILLGGAAATPGLLERAVAAGARVTTSYGMTETAGGCVYDGRPLDGVAVAVDPAGCILVRGATLADGYWVDGTVEPLGDSDGWFRTSDLGRFDGDRLVVTGRADDVVISGGVNVPTAAVAQVLERHPAVAEAAAIGIDDAEWGQRIIAFVVATDGSSPPTPAALRAHVGASAAPAWVPRQVRVVPSIPRTALGKVDRAALRTDADRSGRR